VRSTELDTRQFSANVKCFRDVCVNQLNSGQPTLKVYIDRCGVCNSVQWHFNEL